MLVIRKNYQINTNYLNINIQKYGHHYYSNGSFLLIC